MENNQYRDEEERQRARRARDRKRVQRNRILTFTGLFVLLAAGLSIGLIAGRKTSSRNNMDTEEVLNKTISQQEISMEKQTDTEEGITEAVTQSGEVSSETEDKQTEVLTEETLTEEETKAESESETAVTESMSSQEDEAAAFDEPTGDEDLKVILQDVYNSYVSSSSAQGEVWAIGLTDLTKGRSASINGFQSMKSASVIKLFIMATIYDRVCYPSSEDRHITVNESYDGQLRDLINSMITVSDNTAANTLIDLLGQGDAQAGMDAVNQYCQENGYSQTHLGRKFLVSNPTDDNYTSANDIRNLMAAIYNGKCVNEEASAKMYSYLKNQERLWKIPAGLSGTGAVTANKTGELGGEYGDYVENDVAIITYNDKAYVLSVMSAKLQDVYTAQSRISSISRLVFNEITSGNQAVG